MVSFTQLVVSKKRTRHTFKLCTFGDELRVTGSRNMASDIDRTIASAQDLWRLNSATHLPLSVCRGWLT